MSNIYLAFKGLGSSLGRGVRGTLGDRGSFKRWSGLGVPQTTISGGLLSSEPFRRSNRGVLLTPGERTSLNGA